MSVRAPGSRRAQEGRRKRQAGGSRSNARIFGTAGGQIGIEAKAPLDGMPRLEEEELDASEPEEEVDTRELPLVFGETASSAHIYHYQLGRYNYVGEAT